MEPKQKIDPQKELDIALNELEELVDRLRALYEQYFMGYEKIEPSVQKKDVERRFTVLRKQQIRNTATRFRFNVITQKYNTYSMYWTRICRQIEEGTFKRHIAKAAKRFGAEQNERAGKGREREREREQEASINVELVDLDADLDLDAVMAEVNAAEEARRAVPVPTLQRPVTPTAEIPVPGSARVARHVALPPGARQPLLVRRPNPGQESAPSSSPHPPASAPSPASAPNPASAPGVTPRPMTAAASAGRIPIAPASTRSVGAIPAATPASTRSVGAIPAAAPASARTSVGSIPTSSPTGPQPRSPAGPPSTRLPLPSQPESANRIPAAPASQPGPKAPAPGYRPVALPPGSVNRIAMRTPTSAITPRPAPAPSAPKIAVPGAETDPDRPTPRPPPGLPSQIKKP